jgi:NAD(P)H-flavin reductase
MPMPMTPLPDPAVLRLSMIGVQGTKCANDFYSLLFTKHPAMRDMFPVQMSEQNERLFGALVKIAHLIGSPDQLARYLGQLGADHLKYGVQPEHYAPVGQALIGALRHNAPAWTDEAEAGWLSAYTFAAGAMMAGAERHRGPAQWRGRVVRHERRTRNLAVLEIETDEPLPRLAGQYVTIQTAKWPRVWRPFSVANAPWQEDRRIQLHVRSVPGGWVSTALVRDTQDGDEVIIGPASGTMTTAEIEGRDLMCVAGGTGLAPLKAVVEQVLHEDEQAISEGRGFRRNIHLFHGARNPLDLYDMPALRELSSSYPWLRVLPVVSDDQAFEGLKGHVSDAALGYADWSDRDVFVAGPHEMVSGVVKSVDLAQFGGVRVYYDELEAKAHM